MMKNVPGLILLLIILFHYKGNAQNASIRGTVTDSSLNAPLTNAVVVLLQARDSFIIASTRVNKEGGFSFPQLADTASYVLYFSYPKYASYSYRVNMKEAADKAVTLNNIYLIPKSRLLREVIVKSQVAAIKINGDTTEYNAGSFKVQPNASVEELLRQLPGLQVDQFGNITAQGQKVRKVLVDGEEFFSDDPTLVTRNLRADMIDKVQVYDKKSDAAAFTGIEDGVKDKTINLKIKEDKNHGVFGKVEAGAGTDERYSAQGMMNFFKGRRRISAYATTGNIGRSGLGAADKGKVGSDEDGDGNYSGKGLPKISSGGIHYDKKWNNDKTSFNGNYKFNLQNVVGSEITTSQNNLPSGIILSNSNNNFENSSTDNKLNAKYIYKYDSTATFTVYTDGTRYHSKSSDKGFTQNQRGDSSLIYNNEKSGNSTYDYGSYNVNLSWEKQLKKKGRTLAVYLNNNFSNDATDGENISKSTFYDELNHPDSSALLHLRKKMNDDWHILNLNTIYTEALSKKLSMIVNYDLYYESSHDDKRSYSQGDNQDIKTIDTAFSSKMNSTTWGNQGGISFNYATKKMVLKAGNKVKLVQMNSESIYNGLKMDRQFVNLNPNVNFNYKFSNFEALSVNYNGNSNNPGRWQLLPFSFNNSQLSTFLPNTELNNSFTNDFNVKYNAAKVASQVYYGGEAGYTIVTDPITQSIQVDAAGAYTYQYVNMAGYANHNYNVNTYYSKKISQLDLQASVGLGVNGGKSFSPINGTVNKLNYNTYTFSVEAFKSKVQQYSFYMVGSAGYTVNASSLQPTSKNNYFFYTLNPSLDIYFWKKFQVHTDANYLWQQKTQTFNDNFRRTIWNAWIGRNFFSKDQLLVKISCNDILNENNGYARTATNTFFSENRFSTIRRYFMIGASWNFTKFNSIKQ
ncbi:TonB-dependent receptor [Chitinophaga arvensicola]|uniref:Carboxypeptidase regulatory-like domain-containing protein n=1 Tax=Chitinophaga arvensicola TaxID=29529 RepID=A0A1I0R8Q6_9BACT|nr:TonB-dependent receptor [Chitinophaga arvensicola]SEW37159.1 Carboxypeptidase regulatory-like domain-containing protein [Chitinophaga arvensicola]